MVKGEVSAALSGYWVLGTELAAFLILILILFLFF